MTAAGLDPYFAVGRDKHHPPAVPEPTNVASTSRVESTSATESTEVAPKVAMAQKLRTPTGRALYAARKHIVEPVFGQIKHLRGFRKFSLRGLEFVSAEWQLICLTHNLLKIWRHSASVG